MKILNKIYDAKNVENKKYEFWLNNGYFKPDQNKSKIFSMIIPPPNVTGVLHLGHALDVAIQDTIVRYKKLNGYQVCWIPGTDHAGIATQTKFEAYLKTNKLKSRKELGREEFIKQLWDWSQIQSNTIHEQWRKMGLSLDYDKEKFTMDDDVNDIVNEVFIKLYNDQLIYQGKKLVNWDVKLQTAISDIEVKREPTKTNLYYIKYFLDETRKEFLLVATTRPETMFGDSCLFINPKDKRYKKFLNKKVLNPANNQWIPILGDEYIDMEFGTGVMKCTPAHDFNDYELSLKHHLEIINILNPDGTMNDICKKYQGLDRLKCRELFVNELNENGFIDHIDDNYISQIGYSERTNEIIEPYLSKQWFIKMKPLAEKILSFQKTNKENLTTDFLPPRFEKNLEFWLENIQDWCISRQLWWGHQLPIWYHKKTNEIYVNKTPPTDYENWTRDSDVLDTWFSSGLWPLICFGWKSDKAMFDKYFPTSLLVTGYDILTFWVSRMMMLSAYFTDKTPFKKVYIHGLIRDSQGRKMSKSLGNGVDPMQVIDEYGCDTLRLFLTSSSTIGEDLRYSQEKLKANWSFLNKLWNSARFVISNLEAHLDNIVKNYDFSSLKNELNIWLINELNLCIKNVSLHMDEYNFVVSTKYLIDFVYEKFCSNYLELVKLNIKSNIDVSESLNVMVYVLRSILILLHGQCPFITEEIYLSLPNALSSIMLEQWPDEIKIVKQPSRLINDIILMINAIRRIKLNHKLTHKDCLKLNLKHENLYNDKELEIITLYLKEVVNVELLNNDNNIANQDCLIEIFNNFILEIQITKDKQEEILKLQALIEKYNSEILRAKNILNNQNFIKKAPAEKIAEEEQKLLDYQKQLNEAKIRLEVLKK